MWECASCKTELKIPQIICSNCHRETKLPSNVALAGEDEPNLLKRVNDCRKNFGKNKKAWKKLLRYAKRIHRDSLISINMQPESLLNILQGDQIRYINLHDNLRANATINYRPYLAAKRKAIDILIFGPDGEKLTFGALNMGNPGLLSYGSTCVFLNLNSLKSEISFLETNSFDYYKNELPAVECKVAEGSRALWRKVSMLAILKYKNELMTRNRWGKNDLANLILSSNQAKQKDKFIEAQIYPDITRATFSKIIFSKKHYRTVKAKGLVGKTANHNRILLKKITDSMSDRLSAQINLDLPNITIEIIE